MFDKLDKSGCIVETYTSNWYTERNMNVPKEITRWEELKDSHNKNLKLSL